MRSMLRLAALAGILAAAAAARAADHNDGPAAVSDPTADIADVFAWMDPEARRLNLVMTVGRNLAAGARFSGAVQYVFHVSSASAFGAAGTDTPILCEFPGGRARCWAGSEAYVAGDASRAGGITSGDGRLTVFAGRRNDPFFFNLAGFQAVTRAVTAAAPSLSFDPAGCPALDAATAGALAGMLATAPGGGPAADAFGGQNVLALVVQVDRALVTAGGPLVAVWGATYRR